MAGHRGSGDGSIYELRRDGKPTGQFVGSVSLGRDETGKRIRKAVVGASKREVREKLAEVRRSAHAGVSVQGSPTVAEWLNKWLDQLEAKGKRYGTLRRYSSLCRGHLIPGLGHHRLDKLTRVHVDDFLNAKRSELAPRTVHHLRAVLRTALNRAVKDGRILRNAAALTDPVEVPDEPRRFLTTDEAQAILKSAAREATLSSEAFLAAQRYALYVLALSVGPRVGEALALRWQDVDGGKLSIVYNLQRVRGKLDPTVEPKTPKSRRTVSLPPAVIEALQDQRQRQRELKIKHRPIWQDSDLIFTSLVGSPLDPNDVSRDFRAFLERNELPAVRFHDLRHAAGSIMLRNRVPMHVVSRILGHSTIATTVNIYGHVETEALDEAAAAMGRALG